MGLEPTCQALGGYGVVPSATFLRSHEKTGVQWYTPLKPV